VRRTVNPADGEIDGRFQQLTRGHFVKVLIIRPGALGDTLMLLPAIDTLKRPISIILAARSPGLQILKSHVELGLDFEGADWHGLFAEEPNSLDSLQIPAAECVVAFLRDPEGQLRRNLQARLPRASVHLFPAFPPDDERTHVALYVARCLQAVGLDVDPTKSMARARKHALLGRRDQLSRHGPLVLHPGSGSEGKNHPVGFWLEVIEAIQSSMPGRPVTLLLGPAEERRSAFLSGKLHEEAVEVHVSPKSDRLVTLLQDAGAYVGQDSGITHLAALLGTPTLALFRSSSVHQWHPLGPCVNVIKAEEASLALVREVVELAGSMTGDRRENRPSGDLIRDPNRS
jgi:hypothetical protein